MRGSHHLPHMSPTVNHLGLGQLPQILVGRGRIVHDRQGVQVAAVTGQRLFLIVDQ